MSGKPKPWLVTLYGGKRKGAVKVTVPYLGSQLVRAIEFQHGGGYVEVYEISEILESEVKAHYVRLERSQPRHFSHLDAARIPA